MKGIRLRLLIAFMLITAAAYPLQGSAEREASGEGILDTLFWGPEIVVEAQRPSQEELYNLTGFVALIDLARQREKMDEITSVLATSVGVRVREYGGLGSFATASIRGSSSSQVEFYMDGVPLNDAYTGITNLSDLALGDLDRIEIYRGFSPTGFGSSSIGGTVNLVSRGMPDWQEGRVIPTLDFQAGAGSFETRKYLLTLRSKAGRVGLHVHGGYQKCAGDFEYFDDNATPENPADDGVAVRSNNDFERLNLTGRLMFELPGLSALSLNYDMVDREGGVPGIGANQSTQARLGRERHIAYCKLKPRAALSNHLHTDVTAFYTWSAESFSDPGGDIGLTRQETDNRITMYGGNVRSKILTPVVPFALELFFEGRKERFHPVERLPLEVIGPDRLRQMWTLALSGNLFLFDDRLVLTGGARTQWFENEFYNEPFLPWLPPTPQGKANGDERTPHAGFRANLLPYLTLKGNWGRYYRLPTFFELFGNLGSVTGASDLENEKGTNRDLGVILSGEQLSFIERPYLELVYLESDIENLILFFPNSQYTVKPKNIGSASIRGCELSMSGSLPGRVQLSGNYTYLDGRDESPIPYYNGNLLAGRPLHQANIRVQIGRKRWSADYELHYIGSNFLDQANMKEVAAREIHSASLTLRSPEHGVSFTIEGYNLGNDQISDVSGFPLPGRSFFTSMKISL
jgi:iron complex outermembrane receptor protein